MEVQKLARVHSPAAIASLARIATSKRAPAASVVAACQALLDRAWGKPTQPVEGAAGLVIQVVSGLPRAPDEPRD